MSKKINRLWDLACITSIVGIWPRYIEPTLLSTTRLDVSIFNLPKNLEGLKIVQFSDLHLDAHVSDATLSNLKKQIDKCHPDLIVFTGDFLCYSKLPDKNRLKSFLNSLSAPLGCYAIFGNHDYAESVTVNDKGYYDILHPSSNHLFRAFSRVFSIPKKKRRITQRALAVKTHDELVELLKETPFEVLENVTKVIQIGKSKINCTGLGEYMVGRCKPELAFEGYDERFPGIVLAHNPDSIPKLLDYPGDIILCGHTHGAQVNLPWLWKKFVLIENIKYKRGLFIENEKWIYVNRGVGSTLPFRFFAIPEITCITLRKK